MISNDSSFSYNITSFLFLYVAIRNQRTETKDCSLIHSPLLHSAAKRMLPVNASQHPD
jgi:hypothetical protein